MRATADTLRRLVSAIVKKGGSAAAEADLVADHLVRANLMGHDSHGVGMGQLGVPAEAQRKLLGENARRLYGIEPVLTVKERIEKYEPAILPW